MSRIIVPPLRGVHGKKTLGPPSRYSELPTRSARTTFLFNAIFLTLNVSFDDDGSLVLLA
jgi:hypothetical protein